MSELASERALELLASEDPSGSALTVRVGHVLLRRPPAHLLDRDPERIAERIRGVVRILEPAPPEPPRLRVFADASGVSPTTTLEVLSLDRPFLLSTLRSELAAYGLEMTASFHPILGVVRDADGRLTDVEPARHASRRESILQLEIDAPVEAVDDPDLLELLRCRLDTVQRVVDDHVAMRRDVTSFADQTEAEDPEAAALLRWLLDENVVLLGTRAGGATHGFGLLGEVDRDRPELPELDGDDALLVSRTPTRSPVQRHAPIEVFAVGPRGAPSDQRSVVLALLTQKGTSERARDVPVLRRQLAAIFDREDVVDGSEQALNLSALQQALPKDELFRCDDDRAHTLLTTLLDAEERRVVRVVAAPHAPSRTVSVIAAVPRDRWTADLREDLRSELAERFAAEHVEIDLAVDERRTALARFVVAGTDVTDVEVTGLERRLATLTKPWTDAVRERLVRAGRPPSPRAEQLLQRLPIGYRDVTEPADAVEDLALLLTVQSPDAPELDLELRRDDTDRLRLVAAKRGTPLELSTLLPVLESLGLTVVDEVPHRLELDDGGQLTLHDLGLRDAAIDPDTDSARITEAIRAAWRGHLEVDSLNRCIVSTRLDWHDVGILRALRRYRRQLGTSYTAAYVDEIMVTNPSCVRALVDHLHARFDPAWGDTDEELTREVVHRELDGLARLDHDRALRSLLHLIDATVRTNAFRTDARADGSGEPYVALKVDSSRIPNIRRPVPHREIFVHSPRMEGIHLRAGPVARGGLRWSDRRDDVRAEVLDLLKAQVLKNAVIVPTGAKGGFVLTHEPDDPDERKAEVARQYATFVRGLLDVTDDLDGEEVVPPPEVVRHDGNDPYLVVAADRGTAALSDTANGLAQRYGFWLDDAFASGGSNGYDHKKLGVTAKGAWVAVSRHARELGLDLEQDPATVAGVGDMSGDVFGNAMLRSRTIRLVAAFDHRHVFLDPDPDPAAAHAERQRLFELAGSSWDDYDRDVLSEQGMIVPRDAKRVALTDRVREVLRTDADELSPPELIQAILRAPVDLLFAGGIGTYIKATKERHDELGDRANDELRIDAGRVRARIVGEGANLFITQRARIEFARRGGRINQDAIDNAAGVITSDTEVNLKILLRAAQDRGELDRTERNAILSDAAGEAVETVMWTVDRQTAALSRELARSPRVIATYEPLLNRLEEQAGLHRKSEVLPTRDDLAGRADAGAGLTRPELATLLAWSKRDVKDAILDSAVPDETTDTSLLARAFPASVVERFPTLPAEHRLRRELIATALANDIVDRMGVTFASQLALEADVSLPEVVAAFQSVRRIVDADRWWAVLDELDATQEPDRVRELELPLEDLISTLVRLRISDPTAQTTDEHTERQRHTVEAMLAHLGDIGTSDQRRARIAHARWLVDDLVDTDLARVLASARDLTLVPAVAAVQSVATRRRDDVEVLDLLLRLSASLGIDQLEDALRRADHRTGWSRQQALGLSLDLRRARRVAASATLDLAPDAPVEKAVHRFLATRQEDLDRIQRLLASVEATSPDSLDALAVTARAVRTAIERPRPR